MQIIVLGAGAIGSVYGARLSKIHDVTLIGGAAHVEAIQRDGLVMQGHLSATLPAAGIHDGAVDRARHPDPADHQGQQQRRRGRADRRSAAEGT